MRAAVGRLGMHELVAVQLGSAAVCLSVMIPRKLVHESLLSSAKPHRVYHPRGRVGAQSAPEKQNVRLRPERTRIRDGNKITSKAPRRHQTE